MKKTEMERKIIERKMKRDKGFAEEMDRQLRTFFRPDPKFLKKYGKNFTFMDLFTELENMPDEIEVIVKR